MQIDEFLKTNPNVSITLSATDLYKVVDYAVSRTRSELEDLATSEKEERYLTKKQVMDMLNISDTTVWRWEQKNYLIPVPIGGQRRYKLSSINHILNSKSC